MLVSRTTQVSCRLLTLRKAKYSHEICEMFVICFYAIVCVCVYVCLLADREKLFVFGQKKKVD